MYSRQFTASSARRRQLTFHIFCHVLDMSLPHHPLNSPRYPIASMFQACHTSVHFFEPVNLITLLVGPYPHHMAYMFFRKLRSRLHSHPVCNKHSIEALLIVTQHAQCPLGIQNRFHPGDELIIVMAHYHRHSVQDAPFPSLTRA